MDGYELYIKTKYNEIKLLVDDINDPIVKEILEQPWVEETKIEKIITITALILYQKKN